MHTDRTHQHAAIATSGAGTPSAVPRRSARRATARRASRRRATARLHKDDVDGRIADYLEEHPQSTTGDIARGLNADRGTVAAGLAHIARAGAYSNDEAAEWPWRTRVDGT